MDDFETSHPAPPDIPEVEERTTDQRIELVIRDLLQLAKEEDETPIATWCLRAVEALREGQLRHETWVAAQSR